MDKDGYLCRNYLASPTSTTVRRQQISTIPILETSFEVTQNLETGRIFVYYLEGTNIGDYSYVIYTDDGSTWHYSLSGASWGELTPWVSIAAGPSNNIYRAFSVDADSTSSYEIALKYSRNNGLSWSSTYFLTSNAVYDYNPIVVAANVDDHGVWVIYDSKYGIYYTYSNDKGENWSDERTLFYSLNNDINAYLSDAKFYKVKPNKYVNVAYTVLDTTDNSTKLYWRYVSTSDPTNWSSPALVTDRRVRIGRGLNYTDNGPKLVYSPGICCGSGVVFADYNGGLYFDSPWNTTTSPPTPTSYTLTVKVEGSGRVISSPAGINCANNNPTTSNTCSYEFDADTTVTLVAYPVDGTLSDGTPYTSYFSSWSGACSGNEETCTITMDADKNVTAGFVYLIPPVSVMPLPEGQEVYEYLPVENPVKDLTPSEAKPLAVGNVAGGVLDIQVGFYPFSGPVDVYLAIYAPHIDPDNIYIVRSDLGIQPTSEGIVPWKSNVNSGIDESVFGEISTDPLPSGTYYLGLAVVPAGGDFSKYYLWITYFVIP